MAANEESLQEILRRNPSLSSDQFQARNLAMRSEYCRPNETVLDILNHFRLARLMTYSSLLITTHHYLWLLMSTYGLDRSWQAFCIFQR
jgi:hypothetical protein